MKKFILAMLRIIGWPHLTLYYSSKYIIYVSSFFKEKENTIWTVQKAMDRVANRKGTKYLGSATSQLAQRPTTSPKKKKNGILSHKPNKILYRTVFFTFLLLGKNMLNLISELAHNLTNITASALNCPPYIHILFVINFIGC